MNIHLKRILDKDAKQKPYDYSWRCLQNSCCHQVLRLNMNNIDLKHSLSMATQEKNMMEKKRNEMKRKETRTLNAAYQVVKYVSYLTWSLWAHCVLRILLLN